MSLSNLKPKIELLFEKESANENYPSPDVALVHINNECWLAKPLLLSNASKQ